MRAKWAYLGVITAIGASYGAWRTASRLLVERRRWDRLTADRVRGARRTSGATLSGPMSATTYITGVR